jgi:hypothetical protein
MKKGDVSPLPIYREYLFDLKKLLPEMVGSLLSQSSLASNIQVSPATVNKYLRFTYQP